MYRILFLDQMFPLETGKIIYKDSDQCMNHGARLRELYEIDLKGKPLGMTLHGWEYWIEYYYKRSYHL